MAVMKTGNPFMIHRNLPTIQMTGRKHPSTASLSLMKMAIRKPESVREKEQNTCGSEYPFRLMTGMNTANVNSGESPGRNTVTIICHLRFISITGLMKDRGSILSQLYMRVLLQEKWRKMARSLTDAK